MIIRSDGRTTYFAAAGLSKRPEFIVWHPKAVTGESALVASQPLATWTSSPALSFRSRAP